MTALGRAQDRAATGQSVAVAEWNHCSGTGEGRWCARYCAVCSVQVDGQKQEDHEDNFCASSTARNRTGQSISILGSIRDTPPLYEVRMGRSYWFPGGL